MGAADFPAGYEDAGDDPDIAVPAARVVPEVQALYLDPDARDFPLDENGFYVGIHPVDARVEAQMLIAAGSIKAAPEIGNLLFSYRYATPDITTRVQYEVKRALRDEVQGGNIAIKAVTVETLTMGGFLVELQYVNLRLAESARHVKYVRAQLQGTTTTTR